MLYEAAELQQGGRLKLGGYDEVTTKTLMVALVQEFLRQKNADGICVQKEDFPLILQKGGGKD